MRIEKIGQYYYLTEWWYAREIHRSHAERLRLDPKFAEWLLANDIVPAELFDAELDKRGRIDLDSVGGALSNVPRNFLPEWLRVLDKSNGPKSGGRNPHYDKWKITLYEIASDERLEYYKQVWKDAHEAHPWNRAALIEDRRQQLLEKKKWINQATPAWRDFLESIK